MELSTEQRLYLQQQNKRNLPYWTNNKKPFVFTLDEKTKLGLQYDETYTRWSSHLNDGRKLDLTDAGTRASSVKVISQV